MTVSPQNFDSPVTDIATAQAFLEGQVVKFLAKLNRAHIESPTYIGELTYSELEDKFIGYLTLGDVE
jgi:hypothetical protein